MRGRIVNPAVTKSNNRPFFQKRNQVTSMIKPHRFFFSPSSKLQLQEEGDNSSAMSSPSTISGLSPSRISQQLVEMACNYMGYLNQALSNGWVWSFEDEELLQGSIMLERGPDSIIEQRRSVLSDLASGLAIMIDDIQQNQATIPIAPNQTIQFEFWQQLHQSFQRHGRLQHWEKGFNWISGDENNGNLAYLKRPPGNLPVLAPSSLQWWSISPPAMCNIQITSGSEPTHHPIRATNYWVHIPDPQRQPTRVDRIDEGYPRSNLSLDTPPSGSTQVTRHGQSFPLMLQNGEYFYQLGARRIELPGLKDQFEILNSR